MAFFDGTGSFGLGLGGFDVSDFLGITGSGGFGTQTIGDNKYGEGFNNMSAGQQDYLSSFGDNFTNFDSNKFSGLSGTGNNSNFLNTVGNYGSANTSSGDRTSSNWVDNAVQLGTLANSIYKDYDARKFRDTKYNEYIKDKNDQRAGKKNLIASYYGGADKVPKDNAYYKSTPSKGV